LERHSSFTERTQRSANAFRFGLRDGSFRGFTPPAASLSRKDLRLLAFGISLAQADLVWPENWICMKMRWFRTAAPESR
jgi:hypothetical protein